MPPPGRRPFTTSSLTSTLRSTIASQPILGNTIDKLSSQANSIAQKSSIFGALNQQFQHISQQHQDSASSQNNDQAFTNTVTTTGQPRSSPFGLTGSGSGSGQQQQQQQQQQVSSTANKNSVSHINNSTTIATTNKTDTMTTPTVDMSHLTEEERLMIQSVMAKAEMADAGIPVDTSMPSSTNLPSQTSQALTQQRNQQQQQQRQQQQLNQQQQHLMINSNNHIQPQQPQQQSQQAFSQNDFNNQQQQQNSMNQSQQPMLQRNNQMQQQQQQQPQLMNQQQFGPVMSMSVASNINPNQQAMNLQNNEFGATMMPDMMQQQQQHFGNQNQNPAQQQQQGLAMQQQQPQVQVSSAMQMHNQPASQIESMGSSFGHNLTNQLQPQRQQQSSSQISSVLDQYMPPQIGNANRQQAMLDLVPGGGISQPSFEESTNSMMLQKQLQQPQLQSDPRLQQLQSQQQFIEGQNEPNSEFMQQQNQANPLQGSNVGNQPMIFGMNSGQHLMNNQNMASNMHNQQSLQTQQANQIQQPFDSTQCDQYNSGPNQTVQSSRHHHQLPQPAHHSQHQYSHQQHQQQHQPNQQQQYSHSHQRSIRNDCADYDHAYSDHELHGSQARIRRKREDKLGKQQMSLEVSSSNDWQINREYQKHLNTIGSNDMQAYDLAAVQQSSARSSPFAPRSGLSHRARKLPLQPGTGGLGPLYGSSNLIEQTPQSSSEQLQALGGFSYESSSRQRDSANKAQRSPVIKSSSGRSGVVKQNSNKASSPALQQQRQPNHPSYVDRQQHRSRYLHDEPPLSMTDSEPGDDDLADEETPEDEESLSNHQDQPTSTSGLSKKGRPSKCRAQKQVSSKNSSLANNKQSSTNRNRSKYAAEQQAQASTKTAASETDMDDKEKALQLLSELKLTEQANQVMEQQQQLIKQSQELIKLQQAQLEKQNELKKSTPALSSGNREEAADKIERLADDKVEQEANSKMREQENEEEEEEEEEEIVTLNDDSQHASDANKISAKKVSKESTISKRSASPKRVSSPPASNVREEQQVRLGGSKRPSQRGQTLEKAVVNKDLDEDLKEDEYEDVVEHSGRASRTRQPVATSRGEIKRSTVGGSSAALTSANRLPVASLSSLRHRDPLQSPTDTTDSDIELSASHRRAQRLAAKQQLLGASGKPKGIVRRREPTGLPPSPLPVAAAIQLHQMQQQHYKNQPVAQRTMTAASLARNNPSAGVSSVCANPMSNLYLRSRSVTSSPNLLFERTNGYMTDYGGIGQRGLLRPSSPDTMSEHGGHMRRLRRRLPEPPSNAVPLTPSMVRKMIQAQKAAANISAKLPTSVNAQSTLLTNMHSTRNPSLDRLPNGAHRVPFLPLSFDSKFFVSRPNSLAATTLSAGKQQQSVSFAKTPATSSNPIAITTSAGSSLAYKSTPNTGGLMSSSLYKSSAQDPNHPTTTSSDLNRFLTSISASSNNNNKSLAHQLLNDSRYTTTDIKETPELDKLISNLDDYYGLESKRNQFKTSRGPLASSYDATSLLNSNLSPRFLQNRNINLATTSDNVSAAPSSSYLSRPNYKFGQSTLDSSMARRNSDGEMTGILSRIAAKEPYQLSDTSQQPYPSSSMNASSYNPRSTLYPSQTISKQYTNSSAMPSMTTRDPLLGTTQTNSSMIGCPDAEILSHGKSYGRASYNRNEQLSSSLPGQTFFQTDYSYHDERPLGSDSYYSQYNRTSQLTQQQGYNYHGGTQIDGGRPRSSIAQTLTASDQIFTGTGRPQYGSSSGAVASSRDISFNQYGRHPNESYLNPNYHNRSLDVWPREPQLSFDQANYKFGNPISSSPYRSARGVVYGTSKSSATAQLDSAFSSSLNRENRLEMNHPDQYTSSQSRFAPFTKDDIINHGPKFTSIGYRFGTENQNKYVNEQQRAAIECLQSRYPYPYKRILLSKDPKDRIGNGIGVQIVGGKILPNLYDKVNRCIISLGAFVSAVFQKSSAHLTNELNEGDQIIEWNGVNLCNRSNEEVQQILLSQFSDEEVEIVYICRDQFYEAYGVELNIDQQIHKHSSNSYSQNHQQNFGMTNTDSNDMFDQYAKYNRSRDDQRGNARYANEPFKESIRRKLSLSSISQRWAR